MRSRHVYHMDIKDENLVVDAGFNVKFIDFGSTEIVDVSTAGVDTSLETFRGTYAYAPPEVLTGNRFQPESTEVWSLGTLLYTMIFGQAPFSTVGRKCVKSKLSAM